MNIGVRQEAGRVTVTVLQLDGDLDGSNYTALVDEGHRLYEQGSRDLLLDMSKVNFMSSAGLVALHLLALTFRGDTSATAEDGWNLLHDTERDLASGKQQHVRLLKPQPKVLRSITTVGFNNLFEIYQDETLAIASF